MREHVLQFLFSLSMGGEIELSLLENKASTQSLERAREIFALREQLDEKISKISKEYSIERIDLLDKNILRLALFELLENALPSSVIVSEALRLARKFTAPEAGKFIHAILDAAIALPAREK